MDLATDQRDKILSLLEKAYKGRVSNVKNSIDLSLEALVTAREMKEMGLVGKCLNHLSLFYMIVGENRLSLDASREAITCFTELEDELGIADAKFNIGSVYYKTDNYHAGLINLVDSLAVYKKYKEFAKESRVHKALGTIYEFFSDEKNAFTSYEHAIEAARKSNDLNLESNAYNPLSGIYLNQGNVKDAVELIERAIRVKTETGDVRGLAFSLYGRGKIYTYVGRFDEAEMDFRQAEDIHVKMGEKLGLAMTYYKLGVLFVAMSKPLQALMVLEKGRVFCVEHNISQFKHKCDFQLYLVHKQLGDIEKSLSYLEEHLAVKETVINTETLKVIENYDLISQQQLMENKELMQAKEQAEIQNKELVKANAELDQFVYRASHDLRAPISSIMGLTNIGMMTSKLDEARECFQMINNRAKAQDYSIREIVDYSRNARLMTAVTEIFIRAMIMDVIQSLLFLDRADEIQINVDADPALVIKSDAHRLKSVIQYLMSNAIQYNDDRKPKSLINVSCKRTENELYFCVEDNGIGIVADRQDKIFDMFYRGTEQSTGSGLGLFIVRETVGTLGGAIECESTYGVGSLFNVTIPLG